MNTLGRAASAAVLALGVIGVADLASSTPAAASPSPVCSGGTCTVTFSTPGSGQTWAVPTGVASASFTLYGAIGGESVPTLGGAGAEVTGQLSLTGISSLTVDVGGAGGSYGTDSGGDGTAGINGGGAGGTNSTNPQKDSGGGGGGSDVQIAGVDQLVAGGGGGAGAGGVANYPMCTSAAAGTGGIGGDAGSSGGNGSNITFFRSNPLVGGGGGSAGSSGGAGGTSGVSLSVTNDCAASNFAGATGVSGTTNQGGSAPSYHAGVTSGGGGGGGYVGGGQGGGGAFDNDLIVNQAGMGGGGGGSSYGIAGSAFVLVSNSANPNTGSFNGGNGEVVISYSASTTTTTTSTTTTTTTTTTMPTTTTTVPTITHPSVRVYFNVFSYALTSTARAVLTNYAAKIVRSGARSLHVTGYNVFGGSSSYSAKLRLNRSRAVIAFLHGYFVSHSVSVTFTTNGGKGLTSSNRVLSRVVLVTS